MGQQQSKDELLHQQVSYGNIEGIKTLCREGAGLEWIDREAKTPLTVACMNPELYNVAKTLIELGANVNAYRPGRHAGTPLHHAAKRGLENTVKLLLSHGANALIMNDDCQSPLDVARAKGHGNVVRAIESHICLFSGWMREFYGPGFLEVLAPQLVSRKVWVVILPTGSRNPTKPFKLELAIYPSVQVMLNEQDAQPRTVIALWKADLEEPKLHQSDPSVIIVDKLAIPRGRRRRRRYYTCHEARFRPGTIRQTRVKLAPANESDRQQLQWFCNACKGIPQANPAFLQDNQTPVVPSTAPPSAEDLELAMALSASIQSAMQERPPLVDAHLSSEASTSSTWSSSMNTSCHCDMDAPNAPVLLTTASEQPKQEIGPGGSLSQHSLIQDNAAAQISRPLDSGPSAPPIADDIIEDGPIHYPSIDSSPIDMSSPTIGCVPAKAGDKEDDISSSCVICLDAPVEGACIPCGHMAGCMSCLNEVKAAKGTCPVCRAKIQQVIRLYAV
ncbi:putative E3 ubiquitin-protein ligase XBAT35 isoform X1 [Ziziphus jujuba]|uniref:E3 ubiquitin-protein ligase XBAT35 isoform X1 n=1 Tax=Ziziphus jujuba TaxID=326968 RepID=A0ABM3IRW2_ZIZJJ|nr:putative E3 ubiquitin-protein ligase XBAT35 isoform X1 [Ziziphus jujuba]XP_060671993.1 putative E3 ubiquitin-protein ligase XBAT35 isoform X1 [Ziziphus jujuba]